MFLCRFDYLKTTNDTNVSSGQHCGKTTGKKVDCDWRLCSHNIPRYSTAVRTLKQRIVHGGGPSMRFHDQSSIYYVHYTRSNQRL